MDEDKTCSTCKYKRIMPLWVTALQLEVRYFCCRDKFINVNPDDSCDYWDNDCDKH